MPKVTATPIHCDVLRSYVNTTQTHSSHIITSSCQMRKRKPRYSSSHIPEYYQLIHSASVSLLFLVEARKS